jgi:hypothetical protein
MHRRVTSIRRYDDRQASLADDLLYPALQRFGDGISRERAGLHHALDPPLAGGHTDVYAVRWIGNLRVHAEYVTCTA